MAPRTPQLKPHPLRRLRGALAAGATYANNGILYEVVPVFGLALLTVRAKVVTADAKLDIVMVGPDFDPEQVLAYANLVGTKYTTGLATQVTLTAGTEGMISAIMRGEHYAIVKLTGSGTGAVSFVDVASSPANLYVGTYDVTP